MMAAAPSEQQIERDLIGSLSFPTVSQCRHNILAIPAFQPLFSSPHGPRRSQAVRTRRDGAFPLLDSKWLNLLRASCPSPVWEISVSVVFRAASRAFAHSQSKVCAATQDVDTNVFTSLSFLALEQLLIVTLYY